MVINNGICLQWGRLQLFSKTSGTDTIVTFPISCGWFLSGCVNAGVGTSGWTYMNGCRISWSDGNSMCIQHALGAANSGGELCNWIAITY